MQHLFGIQTRYRPWVTAPTLLLAHKLFVIVLFSALNCCIFISDIGAF